MKKMCTIRVLLPSKISLFMLLICSLFSLNIKATDDENSKRNKLLPPPTPTVVLTLPSGSNCNSVLTASGCGANTVVWFTGSVIYSALNPLTVTSLTPVILKAACFDDVSYGGFSPEYKAVSATYTDITPLTSITICEGNTATLNASSAFAGLSYQWIKNGTNISGATAATYGATTAGSYTVSATNGSCSSTSLARTVNVNAITVPILAPSFSGGCGSQTVLLGFQTLPAGTYQWKLNGTAIGGANSINYSTSVGGSYTLDYTYNGCTVTSAPYVFSQTILPVLTPTFTGPCGSQTLTLTSQPLTPGTFSWTINGFPVAGVTVPTITTSVTGTYALSYTFNSCTLTSNPYGFSQIPTPIISKYFTGTCGSNTVNMSTQSGLTGTFQWKLNGSIISGATTSSYSTNVVGNYTVEYSINGCSTTSAVNNFTQNSTPTIALTPAISPSCVANLTASGCLGSVSWYINTGTSWVLQTYGSSYPFPVNNKPAEYRATCTLNGCESSPSNVVKAIPNNFTEIIPNPTVTICSNASALLNASSTFSGLTYQWRLNTSNISGATSSSYNATSAGNYQLYITNGSCTFLSAIVTVSVTPAPTLNISSTVLNPATIVNGQSLTLTANGCSGGTVLWSNSATTNSITVTPSSNTAYTFTCTQPPCTVISSGFVINVNPLLPPTLTSSAVSTCTGSSVTLTATACAGGGIVTWSTSQTGLTITVSPSISTNYTATCTVGSLTSANSTPLAISVFDGVITSLASGNWNIPATWSCNCIPAACNDVIVDTGHVVTIPATQTGRLKNVTLRGTVEVKNTGIMALK